MAAKLSQDLADALHESGNKQLEVLNPNDNRIYHLVDSETYCAAMAALRRQQDRDAISAGIAQMEAGQGSPLDETFARIQQRVESRGAE